VESSSVVTWIMTGPRSEREKWKCLWWKEMDSSS